MFSFQQNDPLAGYRWKNRVILVFDDYQTSEKGAQQLLEFMGQAAGIVDRDLIVLKVDQYSIKDAMTDEYIFSESTAIRSAYKVPSDEFAILLVGKDGGVKLRSDKMVSSEEIFALIDGMPMRQSEMRRKNAN